MKDVKFLLKKVYEKLPADIKDYIAFYRAFKKPPNLKKPNTFNEKVLYRKRHACITDSLYPCLADKYLVREYVLEKVGNEYLIPLLYTFDSIDKLKEKVINCSNFVLKPNHGAGMVKIIDSPCDEDTSVEIIKLAREWLSIDFQEISGEAHYGKIKKRILMEERIGEKGRSLTDYKIHLFRQKDNDFLFVLQLIDDRFIGELNRTFYINSLEHAYSGTHVIDHINNPLLLKAIELSKVLIGDLEYARIDWYIDNGKLYFGEITLTPAAGLGKGYGTELDVLMGQYWNLELAPR